MESVKIAENIDKGTLYDLRKLIEQNDLDYEDKEKNTLLHLCASSKSYARDKAKLLCEQNHAMILKFNQRGYIPIHTATGENNVGVVEYLAEKGCLNSLSIDKRSPLHI